MIAKFLIQNMYVEWWTHAHLLCILNLISGFHKSIIDGVKLRMHVQGQMTLN